MDHADQEKKLRLTKTDISRHMYLNGVESGVRKSRWGNVHVGRTKGQEVIVGKLSTKRNNFYLRGEEDTTTSTTTGCCTSANSLGVITALLFRLIKLLL